MPHGVLHPQQGTMRWSMWTFMTIVAVRLTDSWSMTGAMEGVRLPTRHGDSIRSERGLTGREGKEKETMRYAKQSVQPDETSRTSKGVVLFGSGGSGFYYQKPSNIALSDWENHPVAAWCLSGQLTSRDGFPTGKENSTGDHPHRP